MKRIVLLIILIIFINTLTFSAFSFKIDGKDTGVEWDGASVYKLIDGESNCGVDFGLVKVKFDFENDAVGLCFLFKDPELSPDNKNAGISVSIEGLSPFTVVAIEGMASENIHPYSFDGAIYLDDNNGATCEVRVGFKSGLPETIDFEVRFIDSQGFYSNYYDFTIVNENYSSATEQYLNPTADNSDPAYNSEIHEDKTTKYKTEKSKTTRKKNTNKSTTDFVIKTSPFYSYTGRTKTTKYKSEKSTINNTTKLQKTKKETVKVVYYEKEIYISEVYVTLKNETTYTDVSDVSVSGLVTSDNTTPVFELISDYEEMITVSKGTKYKKIVSGIGLTVFTALACIGTYSAKKISKKSTDVQSDSEE